MHFRLCYSCFMNSNRLIYSRVNSILYNYAESIGKDQAVSTVNYCLTRLIDRISKKILMTFSYSLIIFHF